ncbi:hypothetical protein OB919_03690 [Halobacteria archaeon AArc-curdl1]|uniref:Domain of unknown function domain-containing protein n=1 Tax=Natronosalvus hydrolyticus TaxID=2979988 RepID=A0AAP3E5J5_9EURY|nr:hypothetical protein [Halobacteria archaeon AArc-curdl1]
MKIDIDRQRGMLTPADRAFLLGEREMSHDQSRRNAEARIRQRVTDTVLDFDLLLHTLSDKDRAQVFDDVHTDDAFLDALKAMIAFTYIGTKEQGFAFEDLLVPAVRASEEAMAAKQAGTNVSVEVTFDVETTVEDTLEGVAARLASGEPITPRELFSLIMQGGHDPTRYDEIVLHRRLEADDGVDDAFLERLASYLEADLEHESETRAVIYP